MAFCCIVSQYAAPTTVLIVITSNTVMRVSAALMAPVSRQIGAPASTAGNSQSPTGKGGNSAPLCDTIGTQYEGVKAAVPQITTAILLDQWQIEQRKHW
jgi:hypothetical protein